MSPLALLREYGLQFSVTGDAGDVLRVEPRTALTDELRELIRTNKAAILRELAEQAATGSRPSDLKRQERIDRAIRMLQEAASGRAAFIAGQEEGGIVPITIVIRSKHELVAGELAIPQDRWDPALFLRFLQDQDATEPM
jgi:hypothetical protein